MAMCREAAWMMGGTVEVDSSLGVGSTFRVELTVEIAKESEADSALAEIEFILVAPGQPQFRILLIEDDEANRLLLTGLLKGAGFQIRTATDGETGIDIFSEWQPHFIWLDIRLPGMNGLEVANGIRTLPGGRDVKIAALTASVFDEQRDRVLAAGTDDFVRKPWAPKTIFECMERLLGVRYVRSAPAARRVACSDEPDLSEVKRLPEDLKSQLLNAVLLLEKERIIDVIRLVTVIDPALGRKLRRHADALEFTPIMRAVLSKGAS